MRSRCALILICCLATAVHARIAEVQSTSRQIFSGHVRFTSNGVVIVNSERGLVVTVPSSNVLHIAFADEPTRAARVDMPAALPAGWREMQIGSAQTLGSTRVEGASYTVRGAGTDVGGELDSFHYVFTAVEGDRDIVARVASVQHTDANAKAGLMMRESVSEYSRHVTVGMSAQRGGFFQARYFDGVAAQSAAQPSIHSGTWLKLRRRGTEFTAFRSPNGRQWTQVEQTTVPMRNDYYVGLAVASGRKGTLNWSTFDHVREGAKVTTLDFTPQVELVSGSVIAGRPMIVNRKEIEFFGGPRVTRIAPSDVARIFYQPASYDMAWKSRASRPGVWVPGGDFFEGELQEIFGDKLRVSSVLYGLRTFDVDEDVVALVLKPSKRERASVELSTRDGSRLSGKRFAILDGAVQLYEPALGLVTVPASEVAELRVR